jgi:hypothetical protein
MERELKQSSAASVGDNVTVFTVTCCELSGSTGLNKCGARLRSLWWAPKSYYTQQRKGTNIVVH